MHCFMNQVILFNFILFYIVVVFLFCFVLFSQKKNEKKQKMYYSSPDLL